MKIEKFTGGSYATNGYLVHGEGEAVLIDAPANTSKMIQKFLEENGLKLKYIIATHVHWDHVEDANKMRKTTGAKICLHALDEENQHEINSIFEGDAGLVRSDSSVDNNDKIIVKSANFIVLHTPGHTPGSICLYNEKENVLFSGDTLFAGSYGRIDFPLSDSGAMKDSLKRLGKLPADTKVCPGHGIETTIGKEKWIKEI